MDTYSVELRIVNISKKKDFTVIVRELEKLAKSCKTVFGAEWAIILNPYNEDL